ncbi:hypothetical protein Arnit_0188 [Arcobacter nitrofigilis DSM 7299]|uniref:Uncharacterized protein n=1 Tax=Arcobacter nitrofigilis (strain ATCC 33309 / DSM 7299 / CCUG 15893 / LMG 7604 / NCTC 12251 / CI) TaxID=572480 RepID=D5V4C2_ARCNC|nr:hypothetical protein [Arcobacter nitrofigilis]ADG91855.1 hypothetical protein Arnit_0188 [Arcobacter nitrofigilis DSM 7299]
MKKGLHVSNGFNVNLENVCTWKVQKEWIQIETNSNDGMNIINIILETSNETVGFSHRVPVNEFKRIEREISEYMGGK